MFRKKAFLFLGGSIIPQAASSISSVAITNNDTSPAQAACRALQSQHASATYFSNSTTYVQDNTDYWSQASALDPACIFAPSHAEELGDAVKILKEFGSPFAMRGGGHMPIGDFNNINSTGVLLSSSGFKQLELEDDGESVYVGPSNHWQDVSKYLEPYGKVVVGGRLGIVGIPGFVTGGGISFFSAEYGWASNNVKSYTVSTPVDELEGFASNESFQVVLADGSVAKVTPNDSYADLFWALRGGGNSFALVTDLELNTYDVPVVSVGITTHANSTNSSSYYENVVDFALHGQTADKKASVIPVVNTGNTPAQSGSVSYTTYRFWGGNVSEEFESGSPESLSYFVEPKLRVDKDTFSPKSMHEWSEETAPSFAATQGLRQRFYTPLTLRVGQKAQAVAALEIIHRLYFDAISSALSDVDLWFTGLSPFPMSANSLAASAYRNNTVCGLDIPAGDPMGIEPENLIVVELSVSYANNASYEPIITDFLHGIGRQIREDLARGGLDELVSPWIYLNDADKGQDVFGGYPKNNVEALQQIREKYDPDRVFTDLMPGGWKVAHA